MADEGEGSDSRDELKEKMLAICEFMISRVHGMTVEANKKLTAEQMKSLMFVIREAWYLSNDRFGELSIEEFEKLQAIAQDEDDENAEGFETDDEEEDEEDDDDPFGLRGE